MDSTSIAYPLPSHIRTEATLFSLLHSHVFLLVLTGIYCKTMASKVETLLSASQSLSPSFSLRGAASYLATHPILAVAGLVGLWLAYQLLKAAYNVSPLHPLSHIPGPRLAAATYWPEFYHDVILFGRYTRQIEKMHRKYGLASKYQPYPTSASVLDSATPSRA